MASSLSVTRLDAGYGAVRVLEDVSLSVAPGQTVVLLGTNGNGKSTLMKCVMGMVRPVAGSIIAEINGQKHDLVGRSTEEIVDLGDDRPGGRRHDPHDAFHQRALAVAVGAEQYDGLAGLHRQRHVLEHPHRAIAGVEAGHGKTTRQDRPSRPRGCARPPAADRRRSSGRRPARRAASKTT